MTSQFLTAVFELRPSRRKAAALERVRAATEALFWSILEGQRARADVIAAVTDKKERRAAWRVAEADLARVVLAAATKQQIAEPVAQGLQRDITMAIGSYIESRAGGHDAEWPSPAPASATDPDAALASFVGASTREHEREARDALATLDHPPGPRPLTIARARDARLIRQGPTGGIAVLLNVLRATDPAARPATIQAGMDAATGEVLKAGTSKTRLIIPVACSKWHEQKFLSGRAILRSSLIRRAGDRWFMCAQFAFAVAEIPLTGARLGIDRGVVNPIATAVVGRDGAVRAVREPAGQEIGRIIQRAEERRKREQKRRETTSVCHRNALNNQLHALANGIVAEARQHGARVVVEKLDGFKSAITERRPAGARNGGWRKVLKRVQLGKLETILEYKLKMAGLPSAREVVAGGTSITCPACGARDAKNRPEQAVFACVACGFTAAADSVAAVNIGRRDVAMETITRGAKLAPLEQDMAVRLRSRGDGGLGPLAAGLIAAGGFVAARAAAGAADPSLLGLTVPAGQEVTFVTKNQFELVLAERGGAFSRHNKRRGRERKQSVAQDQLL